MTVTYYPKIATIKFASTLRLLIRWKGSLYKLVLPDIALFCTIYTTMSMIYRFGLTDEQRRVFEMICVYARDYSGTTTVTFCLGFFGSYVLGRWWEYFKTMPWMYTPGYHIRQVIVPPCVSKQPSVTNDLSTSPGNVIDGSTNQVNADPNHNVNGIGGVRNEHGSGSYRQRNEKQDAAEHPIRKQYEEAMLIRMNLIRYLLVGWIWMMRRISKPVLVRFKPQEHLSECTLIEKLKVMNCDPFIQKFFPTLLTDTEIEAVIAYAKRICGVDYEKYEPDHFLPMGWASDLVHEARARGYIPSDFLTQELLTTLKDFRGGLGMLRFMDMFNVPLVYTQVVALCCYIYLILNCFATQFTDDKKPDVYVPVPFILQLMFLFGWLRVSEVCLNPFGEDDDDFPTWQILNMNLETSFRIISVFDREYIEDMFGPASQKNTARKITCGEFPKAARRRASMQSGRSGPTSSQLPSVADLPINTESNLDKYEMNAVDDSHTLNVNANVNVNESEHSYLIVSEHNDDEPTALNNRHRANYEKFKKKYDRPLYLGSALENELSNKQQLMPEPPKRAQSKLSIGIGIGVSKLFAEMMQLPSQIASATSRSNLTTGSKLQLDAGSRINIAGSKTNVTSSKLHLGDHDHDHYHDHDHDSSVHEHDDHFRSKRHGSSESNNVGSQLSIASVSGCAPIRTFGKHMDAHVGAFASAAGRSRHTSIVIPPLASALRRELANSGHRRPAADSPPSNEQHDTTATSRLNQSGATSQQSAATHGSSLHIQSGTSSHAPPSPNTNTNASEHANQQSVNTAATRDGTQHPVHGSSVLSVPYGEQPAKPQIQIQIPIITFSEAPSDSPRLTNRQLQFSALSDSKHNLNQITETAEPPSPSSSSSSVELSLSVVHPKKAGESDSHSASASASTSASRSNIAPKTQRRKAAVSATGPSLLSPLILARIQPNETLPHPNPSEDSDKDSDKHWSNN